MNWNLFANLAFCGLALVGAWRLERSLKRQIAAEGPELDGILVEGAVGAAGYAVGPLPSCEHVHCTGCGAFVERSEVDAHQCDPGVRQ